MQRGSQGALARGDDLSCVRENLRPCDPHEVEFCVKDALTYAVGASVRGPSCVVGNFRFRLLIFPNGTHSSAGKQVSAFVEADPWEYLDQRWAFNGVKYQCTLINWLDYRKSVTKVDTWTFSKEGIDRGWHDMIRTGDLSQESGWLGPDNTLCFRASCHLRQADSINVGNDYNIRRETSFIGLKNHGATCYMNGLLQCLFHVGEFRRIVYSIDCDDVAEGDKSDKSDGKGPDKSGEIRKRRDEDDEGGEPGAPPLIQALQNVFYKLQTADQAVTCRELMKSFGWDNMDAFTQHDAQELNRILCDRLEERMKGTAMDGSIKKLFEGEMINYIECCEIDYTSQRTETFYDVQLNIKGERGQELLNIDESLKDFTAEETLEDDNAYEAEGHGKQRAKKGIRFKRFPPVLNLQLKRFHFDLEKMDMVKLNSRFEFPTMLDLRGFAPGAGQYMLHTVVVHSGDVNSGHYYAHIKPTPDGGWVKFDDETVTPCSEFAAVEDNFGGSDLTVHNYFDRTPRELQHYQPPVRARIHNAYMLVYIREDCVADICSSPDPMGVNSKMVERCDQEVHLAEQRRREKMEANLKIKIKLVFEKDIINMCGFWDHEKIVSQETLKIGRDQLVKELAAEVEQSIQVPRNHLVFFLLHYRNNPRQVRFAFILPNSTFKSHIPQFNAPHFDTANPYLTVLCIASRGYDIETLKWSAPIGNPAMKPDELAEWSDDNSVMLLCIKYFCPRTHKIVTLGCYYVQANNKLNSMVTDGWVAERLRKYLVAKEVAPLPAEGTYHWECYEEFSELDIQNRAVTHSAKQERLWSGDLLIWQVVLNDDVERVEEDTKGLDTSTEGSLYPINNVADYAAHVVNSIDAVVMLHDYKQPLAIDGAVSNGHWTASRTPVAAVLRIGDPAKKDPGSPTAREERPEDPALQLSPAQFKMPVEKEIKMDLRWNLQHTAGTIVRAFDLPLSVAESQLWLFNGAPSSSPEEPLNFHTGRTEQTTLKDVQRSVMYASVSTKKPLNFHVVELPFQPGPQLFDRNMCPLCVRFFDDATREVGSAVVLVPNGGTVQDVLLEAEKQLKPEWGITLPLRLMECPDSRLHEIYKPDAPVRTLLCFTKSNIFYHCLRVEADPESAHLATPTNDGHLMEIFHSDRQSLQAFGQPFLLSVTPGEKASSIKARIKTKLRVQDTEFKSWRLVRISRTVKTHLKDDDAWEPDPTADAKLCVEHSHPNPSSSLARQSRHNKPLTIK